VNWRCNVNNFAEKAYNRQRPGSGYNQEKQKESQADFAGGGEGADEID